MLEKVKIEEFGFEKEPTDINPTISIQKISKVNKSFIFFIIIIFINKKIFS